MFYCVRQRRLVVVGQQQDDVQLHRWTLNTTCMSKNGNDKTFKINVFVNSKLLTTLLCWLTAFSYLLCFCPFLTTFQWLKQKVQNHFLPTKPTGSCSVFLVFFNLRTHQLSFDGDVSPDKFLKKTIRSLYGSKAGSNMICQHYLDYKWKPESGLSPTDSAFTCRYTWKLIWKSKFLQKASFKLDLSI